MVATVVDPTATIVVSSVTLSENSQCSYSLTSISSVILNISHALLEGESITKVVLTDGIDSSSTYSFSSCVETTKLQWTCSLDMKQSESEISISGTYTVESITASDGNNSLAFSLPINTLKIASDYVVLNEQTDQTVNTADNANISFNVIVKDASAVPSIYVENDENSLLTCTEKDSTTLVCTVKYMTESKEYQIYYKDVCSVLKPLLKVTNVINTIVIQSLTISGYEGCSINVNDLKEIYMKTAADSSGSISAAVFVKSGDENSLINYSCGLVADTITDFKCTTEDVIAEGEYSLKSVNSLAPRTASDVILQKMTYKANNLDANQTQSQEISSTKTTFVVLLASSETATPKIYIDDTEITTCDETKKPTVTCTVPDSIIQTQGTYTVMYENSCGQKITTGIELDNDSRKNISVSGLSLDGTCKSELSQITFTASSAPTGSVTINLNGAAEVSSSTCSFTELVATCSISISTKGTYTIESFSSTSNTETFILPSEKSITYEPLTNNLAVDGQTNSQTIDASQSKTIFTIVLDGIDKSEPIIYLSNDITNVVPCERDGTTATNLVCTPTLTNMPDSDTENNYDV